MKKTTAIVSALLVGTAFASAQEDVSVSVGAAYETDYIFRGAQFAEDYFAPSVDVTFGNMYAGIWAALPTDSEYEDEIDFYGGVGVDLSETISADFGFTYYTFDETDSTIEAYSGLSFDVPLSPSVYVFYDFDLEALTIETSAGQSWEVSDTTAVELAAYLGYVDASGADSYFYYGVGVSYSIALGESASASVGVNWYGVDEENFMFEGDENKVTVGGSISFGF